MSASAAGYVKMTKKGGEAVPWYVYMLRCGDDSLYTGSTTDVQRRFQEHRSGTGARYTRSPPRR